MVHKKDPGENPLALPTNLEVFILLIDNTVFGIPPL